MIETLLGSLRERGYEQLLRNEKERANAERRVAEDRKEAIEKELAQTKAD